MATCRLSPTHGVNARNGVCTVIVPPGFSCPPFWTHTQQKQASGFMQNRCVARARNAPMWPADTYARFRHYLDTGTLKGDLGGGEDAAAAQDVALARLLAGAEVRVEPHEQERVADPHDGRDHVDPADQ